MTSFKSRQFGHNGLVSSCKSLWSSVQGDPVFMRRVNGWLTIFWVVAEQEANPVEHRVVAKLIESTTVEAV